MPRLFSLKVGMATAAMVMLLGVSALGQTQMKRAAKLSLRNYPSTPVPRVASSATESLPALGHLTTQASHAALHPGVRPGQPDTSNQALSKAGSMPSKGLRTLAEKGRLLPVLKRFPEERASLQRLFLESSSFQPLCDDYRDCLAALQYWKNSTSGEAPGLARAYADLLQEMEQEVHRYLDHEKATPTNRP
jgi:hypothetical protein